MPKIDDQITKIQKEMEQQRNRLRDLKARATKQDRKDDARKKILYGAAYLAGLHTLSEAAQKQSLTRVHAQIRNARDRGFLGLPPLTPEASKDSDTGGENRDAAQDLPFGPASK